MFHLELQERFQDKATCKDIWQHRRVIVRGRVKYGGDRSIDYVFATDIRQIDPAEVSLENIADRSFTGAERAFKAVVKPRKPK